MKQQKHLFDEKKNITRLLYLLYFICLLLFILDFFLHRHVSQPLEALPGFYPLYGFLGCVMLVVIAKWLRTLLMRSENYYRGHAPTYDKNDKVRMTKHKEDK